MDQLPSSDTGYYARAIQTLIEEMQVRDLLDTKSINGLMALKNLNSLKCQLDSETTDGQEVAKLETKLMRGMPSLARLTRLLVTEETSRLWAKQDWSFILLSVKVHESLIRAQGNSEKHRLVREIIPARLAVYQAMDEVVYARTEQLMRLIEQDEGYFSRVGLRKSLSLDEGAARQGDRHNSNNFCLQDLDEKRPLNHKQ